MAEIKVVSCGNCGYEWQQGRDGNHQCSEHMVRTIKRQAAEIERLQHQADQVDQIDVRSIVDALSWLGVSTPEGGTEAAAARLGRLVNDLSAAVLRHKLDHRNKCEEIERLKAAQSMPPASATHGEIALRWRVQDYGLYAVDMMVSNLKTEDEAHAAMAYVQSLFAGDEMAGRY